LVNDIFRWTRFSQRLALNFFATSHVLANDVSCGANELTRGAKSPRRSAGSLHFRCPRKFGPWICTGAMGYSGTPPELNCDFGYGATPKKSSPVCLALASLLGSPRIQRFCRPSSPASGLSSLAIHIFANSLYGVGKNRREVRWLDVVLEVAPLGRCTGQPARERGFLLSFLSRHRCPTPQAVAIMSSGISPSHPFNTWSDSSPSPRTASSTPRSPFSMRATTTCFLLSRRWRFNHHHAPKEMEGPSRAPLDL